MQENRLSRRALLVRCALLLLPSIGRAESSTSSAVLQLKALEAASGTRIGLAAVDTGNGRILQYREGEHFLFCSTWKYLVVAALLARVDRGEESLNRLVRFSKSDLVPYAPIAAQHLNDGMTLDALCHAAITVSDNAAANLLLNAIGGIASFNAFVRSIHDDTTTLNRNEPTLNDPDGDKDTTTPGAMLADLKAILLGAVLKPDSRQKLLAWLHANTTGGKMLRAGLPADWKVGDKTGHGDSASNDIAIVTPPGRAPILVAVYTMTPRGTKPDPSVVPAIAKIIGIAFAS